MARKLIEAESPKGALDLMRPMRIFVAIHGDTFAGSFGYPHLPVFSSDPERLQQLYPNATVIECIARPTRIVTSS